MKPETLKNLCSTIRKYYKKEPLKWHNVHYNNEIYFDFPNYGNLPKRISNRLTSDLVDAIQEYFYLVNQNKEKFTVKNMYRKLRTYQVSGYEF